VSSVAANNNKERKEKKLIGKKIMIFRIKGIYRNHTKQAYPHHLCKGDPGEKKKGPHELPRAHETETDVCAPTKKRVWRKKGGVKPGRQWWWFEFPPLAFQVAK